MDNNLKLILQEFQELKGQFVINDSWDIERLVAVGEDDMDYYWITYDGRKLKWNTCVGRVMPLKGHLRDKDYAELVRLAKLNHYDQVSNWGKENSDADKFSKQHKQELEQLLGENDKYLTEICWDLN